MRRAIDSTRIPPDGASPLRLLVVETSEQGFIRTLDMLSGARGVSYSVDWVTRAELARERISRERYDFVLVGLATGRLAALDLLRHAALQPRQGRALLVSDTRDPGLAADARRAGAAAYLVRNESGGAALERAILAAARAAREEAVADVAFGAIIEGETGL